MLHIFHLFGLPVFMEYNYKGRYGLHNLFSFRYQLTISSLGEDVISMTTPHCNKYGPGMAYTLARSLHSPQGTPLAVVAGDFTLQYIMKHFITQVPECKLAL